MLACAQTSVAPPTVRAKVARATPPGCVAPDGSIEVEPDAEYRIFAPIIGIEDFRPKVDAGCPVYDAPETRSLPPERPSP